MRILHVSAGNLYGGVETFLTTLALCQGSNRAVESAFALCFPGRLHDELVRLEASVFGLGPVRSRNPASVWRARRALRQLLQRERFDLVICHAPWSQAIFGPAVRSLGVPLGLWVHGTLSGRHWIERWASRTSPDLVITNSHFTASTVPALYPTIPCHVLYYPVSPPEARDPGVRDQVRAQLGTAAETVVIIQVSRMEEWKGHRLHLEALAELRDLPGWECWQVGGAQRRSEHEYLAEVQALAATLGIDRRVRFLGQRADVAALLAAADIHCQPNTGPEPFGITFVEALQAGRPVVTTAIGGAREIVENGVSGILVPPDDPSALSDALRRLIENGDLRRKLGSAGPRRALGLTDPATQLNRFADIVRDLRRRSTAA